jgi:hypothetical protein
VQDNTNDFLVQTFALGATEHDVAISLGLMDKAVSALRDCVVDDVHLGIRFADLLATLTSRIRSRFVRMAATGPGSSHPNSNAGDNRESATNGTLQNFNISEQLQQQWQSNGYDPTGNNQTNGTTTNGRTSPIQNPLLGISTESIDPTGGNVSIMPPPSFAFTPSAYGDGGQGNGGSIDGNQSGQANFLMTSEVGYMPDWLALPLDPLLNSYGAGVNQTAEGVNVGGYDLLDILLNEMDGGTGGSALV